MIAAPVLITIWIVWWFISWVDGFIKPLIPWQYNPDHYLPFPIPGFGLLVALVALTLLGLFAANLIGRTLVNFGELAFERTPVVSTIYRGSRQIFETFFSAGSKPFRSVGPDRVSAARRLVAGVHRHQGQWGDRREAQRRDR